MERFIVQPRRSDGIVEAVSKAVRVLERGGVIVYPTDTVYGLGADATNRQAVQKIQMIKQRASPKPILVMVPDIAAAEQHAFVTPLATSLAQQFWPGPLSMELKKKPGCVLECPIGTNECVSFRCPLSAFCLQLTHEFGRAITSTSVNVSGQPQPAAIDAMLAAIQDELHLVDLVIDVGTLPMSEPSTLVEARGTRARIIRKGAVPAELLERFL
jgi:L-threonylcarbamoyladenylate synthase